MDWTALGAFGVLAAAVAVLMTLIYLARHVRHGAASAADRQPGFARARRRKRLFATAIETCWQCGGRLRVIACIEQPAVIGRILGHLGRAAGAVHPARS
jgi:hypothetical protein